MLQTTNHTQKNSSSLLSEVVVSKLKSLCECCFHSVSYYPYAKSAKEKFETIEYIRKSLNDINYMLTEKQKIQACLRLELSFHQISYSPTSKLRKAYLLKLNDVMDTCRSYLGRVKQW